MISCHGISKSYNKQLILSDISLSFNGGEISTIIGASGSGKSTLLNIVSAACSADAGEVVVDQQAQLGAQQQQKNGLPAVGMVQQKYNLWPHLTVLDNLILAPTKVLKQSIAVAKENALAFLAEFELSDKADVYPNQLSGGQQQRVAIIRSMLMPYSAIALDEPTAALDPMATALVANTLIAMKKTHKAMIVTTHNIDFAKQISDKVFFIKDGVVAESGGQEILSQPKTCELKLLLNIGEKS